MSVWYLESDDEITDAVARLRATEDERVVLVVPPGSRIATGRINFRLLAREATARKLAFAVVSPDEQVRALAIAGGVVARASVDEAEGALDRGEPPAPAAPPDAPTAEAAASAAVSTDAAARTSPDDGDGQVAATRTTLTGSRRRRVAATSVVLIGLVLVGGWAGYRFLPSASITIEPDSATLGPILVSVKAAAEADVIDVARGEIPAVAISIPLTVKATFPASGRETSETAARGVVVFSSAEQAVEQPIAAGTRVATAEGVEFQTTQGVALRPSVGGPGPAEVRVPIEAVVAGPEGDVEAGTITRTSLGEFGISVTNPEPTTGGDRQQTPYVTQADYDAAAIDLQNRLSGELARQLRDPSIVPEGLTLFAETARLGSIEDRPAADVIVGSSAPEFELTGVTTAHALAVDETLIGDVTAARLAAEAPEGMALRPETVRTEAGTGTARGDAIDYAASATGTAYSVVDPDALAQQVRGLPVSDARSILDRYGTASVTVWPDFLGTLPEDADRIDVVLKGPSTSDAADDG
jgi:hypothetical protein